MLRQLHGIPEKQGGIQVSDTTYAIFDTQTGNPRSGTIGKIKPSEDDLREHDEIVIWDEDTGEWVQPEPEPTAMQKTVTEIRAYLNAADDLLDDLEDML